MSISTTHIGTSTNDSSSNAYWQTGLYDRIHVYRQPVEKFLDTFVPTSHPYNPPPARQSGLDKAFSQFKLQKGREANHRTINTLVKGMSVLVAPFDTAHKVSFHNTRTFEMPFPFAAFAEKRHACSPDISVSFPGANLSDEQLRAQQWQAVSMAIDVTPSADQDPFPRPPARPQAQNAAKTKPRRTKRALAGRALRLARMARNLLLAHGALAVFVLGIYGSTVRLARFDHACAVVSRPINSQTQSGRVLLQRFFWHFVHPAVCGSRARGAVVGCDPTVRPLNTAEQDWVKAQLTLETASSGEGNGESLTAEIAKGRRVVVFNEANRTHMTYLLYHLVDINPRLFSRATTVWRAMEDTRHLERAAYSEDGQPMHSEGSPGPRGMGKTVIFKEAWRQLSRRTPEVEFYKRMAQTFGDDETKWHGLAKFVCGGDQGQEDVLRWERSSPNVSVIYGQRDLRFFTPTTAAPSPPASSADDAAVPQDAPYEVPYPQHQTFSWTLAKGKEEAHRERSQVRIVVEDVGRPLTTFTSTYELVCAIMAAIEGHKTAWETAGIMHRDVSLGNILISSDPTRQGFLHDFDYSSMEPVPPGHAADASTPSGRIPSDDARKERTGTYYYMAVELLENEPTAIIHCVYHDLESFYWVLLWVILRHTIHNLGQEYCAKLFIFGDDDAGATPKSRWIHPFAARTHVRKINFQVQGNTPLTTLIEDFRILLDDSLYNSNPNTPQVELTYDSVLDIFRKAVADQTAWPANDFVHCTLLKKTLDTAIVGAPSDTHGIGEDEGVDLDADFDEDECVDLDADLDVDSDNHPEEEPAGDDMDAHDVQAEGDRMGEDDERVEEADFTREDQFHDTAHSVRNAAEPAHAPTVASDDIIPVVEDPVTNNAATEGDPQPQQFGMTTRLRAKRSAAVAVEPAPEPGPSRSGSSSKRRRTNSQLPTLARSGSRSQGQGKAARRGSTSDASGNRGRR